MKKRLSISLEGEVLEKLEKGSKRYGLSLSGYISQLIMQKDIEMESMRLVSKLSDEQIAEEVRRNLNPMAYK